MQIMEVSPLQGLSESALFRLFIYFNYWEEEVYGDLNKETRYGKTPVLPGPLAQYRKHKGVKWIKDLPRDLSKVCLVSPTHYPTRGLKPRIG